MATMRARAKAHRQQAILHEAARLFAARGFAGVSLEELGGAVGVRGPALYRHFASKQALLDEILTGVSERLRDGGRAVTASLARAPGAQLADLVRFHVAFALEDADVIRVQDRDLQSTSDAARHRVRTLQREYVEMWVGVLRELHPTRTDAQLRVRAHAVFGLINSTPHSVRDLRGAPSTDEVRAALEGMALAALTA